MNIGFLHPGEMGVALARAAQRRGHVAHWDSSGRSDATRRRAAAAGLVDCRSLAALASRCELLVSICPPQAAQAVADAVADVGFSGLFVEANAIAPERARTLAGRLVARGARVVDAALVGPPPGDATAGAAPAATRMLLAGPERAAVAAVFDTPSLVPLDLGPEIGRASALKLLHSALHKGLLALQEATADAASRAGLATELEALLLEREVTAFHVRGRHERRARLRGKALRFAAEMDELASLLEGFPQAAAAAFRRHAARTADAPDAPDGRD